MSVSKEARRDAKEYARAQMFYGEGAGVRRKLIQATVEGKAVRNPAYSKAFHAELARQDMAEHAAKARKERLRKDATHAVNKNVRGLATGNYQSVSSGLLVVVAVGYFAHKTGVDKLVYDKVKETYGRLKRKYQAQKAVDDVYNITDLTK